MYPALLDSNVLVHAAYQASPLHEPAARLVDLGLRRRGRFCIAPQNIVEFVAVGTRPRAVRPPLSPEDIHRMAGRLARSRCLRKIHPRRGTVLRAVEEGARLGVRGTVWYDLFLALTMRDNGIVEIVTENASDFLAFPFVTTRDIRDRGLLS